MLGKGLALVILSASANALDCTSNDVAWGTGTEAKTLKPGESEKGYCALVTGDSVHYKPEPDARFAERTCREDGDLDSGDNVDLSGCYQKAAYKATVQERCPPIGPWPEEWNQGTDIPVTRDCTLIDSNLYSAGSATRVCKVTGWSDVDATACEMIKCAAAGPFAETAPTAETMVKCNTYDAAAYGDDSTNDAGRWCYYAPGANPVYANEKMDNVQACKPDPCDAANGFTAAESGKYGEQDCTAYDADLYMGPPGAKAKILCLAGKFTGKVDVSACQLKPTICPADSAWPESKDGIEIKVSCELYDLKYQSGNDVSRSCNNGKWEKPIVTSCVMKECPSTNTVEGNTLDDPMPATEVDKAATLTCRQANQYYVDNAQQLVSAVCTLDPETGDVSFTDYNAENCVWANCNAASHWDETESGMVDLADCAVINPDAWKGGSASRGCIDGQWEPESDINYTMCIDKKCPYDGGFTSPIGANTDITVGNNAQQPCAEYQSANYDSTDKYAVKKCHAGDTDSPPSLGYLDLSACIPKASVESCKADGPWYAMPNEETATLPCDVANGQIFTHGAYQPAVSATIGLATRKCGGSAAGVWSDPDYSKCTSIKKCPAHSDLNGFQWPETPVFDLNTGVINQMLKEPCATYSATFVASGHAYKECKNVSGSPIWQPTNLNLCFCPEVDSTTGYKWLQTRYDEEAKVGCMSYNAIAFEGNVKYASRKCTVNGWANVNTSACTKNSSNAVCSAVTKAGNGYDHPEGFEGETDEVKCSGIQLPSDIYTSDTEMAMTQCVGGKWSSISQLNMDACTTEEQCPVSHPYPATNVGETARVFCNDIENEYKQDGTSMATRKCNRVGMKGVWAEPDLKDCVYKSCAADAPWPAADHGVVETLQCISQTAWADKYRAGIASRACKKGVWAPVDMTNCIEKHQLSCVADGAWPPSPDSQTPIMIQCNAAYPGKYVSGMAKRFCSKGLWEKVDTSNCVEAKCPAKDSLPESALGVTATGDCKTLEPTEYKSGSFTALCGNNNNDWISYDVSKCVYVDCLADGPWSQTKSMETAEVDCSTYNADLFNAGAKATRPCTYGEWQEVDHSKCVYKDGVCKPDDIKYWPATASGQTAQVECSILDEGNGYYNTANKASRSCSGGTWAAPDLSQCYIACGADAGFPAVKAPEKSYQKCSLLRPQQYADGNDCDASPKGQCASRLCQNISNQGEFAPVDESDCTDTVAGVKKCVDDTGDGFPFRFNGEKSELGCEVYSPKLFKAGGMAYKTCGQDGKFSAPDVKKCVKKVCLAQTGQDSTTGDKMGNWPQAVVGETVESPCATVFPDIGMSMTAKRRCDADVGTNGVWATPVFDACVWKPCEQSGGWKAIESGAQQDLQCVEYDEEWYKSATQMATRTCEMGKWDAVSTIDESKCTDMKEGYLKCPAKGGFPTGVCHITGVQAGQVALAYDYVTSCINIKDKYQADQQAARQCKATTSSAPFEAAEWGAIIDDNCVYKNCPESMEFPETKSGQTAYIACDKYKPNHYASDVQQASRECVEAEWKYPDSDQCLDMIAGSETCPAKSVNGGNLPKGYSGESTIIPCTQFAPDLYKAGAMSAACEATPGAPADDGRYGSPDVSHCSEITCPADKTNDYEWPELPVGKHFVKCQTYDSDYADTGKQVSRTCISLKNPDGEYTGEGKWEDPDLSECEDESAGISVAPQLLHLIVGALAFAALSL